MKNIGVRKEVVPFILIAIVVFGAWAYFLELWSGIVLGIIAVGYFLYFFRDPERNPPTKDDLVVAGADGVIAAIKEVREDEYLKTDCIRISIFLSLFDVHVNRAPIAGNSKFLGYFRGKHLFTFQEKSSDVNQHNKILITGEKTRCLVTQIVGPICRRVVYWPDHENEVQLALGDRFGMMKFGSRLDMYFPKGEVEVSTKLGAVVRAGITPIARIIHRM